MNATIGIMATDGTIQTELYQKAFKNEGLQSFVPSLEIQKEVMYEIYDCIKCGKPYDAERWLKIEREYKDAGCDCVVLACTELSVIKSDEILNDWYVDAMTVLAQSVVEFAGKEWI